VRVITGVAIMNASIYLFICAVYEDGKDGKDRKGIISV
jgi:hypothetical protein